MLTQFKVVKRLVLSALLGGVIGYEREINNRPAGLRTHILVSLGSTLIMLISIDGFGQLNFAKPADPARLAAQVVSGIGFLGAGTILRDGSNVRGLTTAASLWVNAGIGLAIGAGYYIGGVLTTAMVLLTLMWTNVFSRRTEENRSLSFNILSDSECGFMEQIEKVCQDHSLYIKDIHIFCAEHDSDRRKSGKLGVKVSVRSSKKKSIEDFNLVLEEISEIDGVLEVYVNNTNIYSEKETI